MKNVNHFNSFFEKSQKRKSLVTTEEISYSSKFKFGSLIKSMKKNISFDYQRINNKYGTTILYSTINAKNYEDPIIIELHFFKKRLVFFKYIFPDLKNCTLIESQIKEKYLINDLEENVNLEQFRIEDPFGNFLILQKTTKLIISYYTLNHSFLTHVKEIDKQSKRKKDSEERYLIQNLLLKT